MEDQYVITLKIFVVPNYELAKILHDKMIDAFVSLDEADGIAMTSGIDKFLE